jgi:peptidoglycan/LPS O-acetylase OafA/YrhL
MYARRIPSLDGLRGIAVIAVMTFHFNIVFLPQALLSDIMPFLGHAYLAVDLFFLLSGLVMAHVYWRGLASNWRAHWLQFGIARFVRIYPSFAITTLAMIVIVALSHGTIRPVSFSFRSLEYQPLLLQQWTAGLLITAKRPRLMAANCVGMLAALSIGNGGSINYSLRTLSKPPSKDVFPAASVSFG